MITTVQQIVYTNAPEHWHALAAAFGLVAPYPPSPEWAEFIGDGVLAVHRATPGHPAGRVDVNLLVDDLDAAERALRGHDVVRSVMEGVGEMLTVTAGLTFGVFPGAEQTGGELVVQPIWFHDDIAGAREALEALGLRVGIASDDGGWIELRAAGGGSVGVHAASGRAEGDGAGWGLSFLYSGDLDALAARLRDADVAASVVDESYGRTIRLPDPDGGADIWINGPQTDLYGYHGAS
ncbi:MAG: hypothetical protein WA971_08165 [Microbacterium sp.]